MFTQKDQFIYDILKYRDRFATIINNVEQVEVRHLDFSDKNIVSTLQERIALLSRYQEALDNLIELVEKKVTDVLMDWMQTIRSMEPDTEKMTPLELANHHLIAGSVDKTREILESDATGPEGLTKKNVPPSSEVLSQNRT
ncbi:MAG: hypothetical protein U9N36_05045 [Euryarchaeota archaeon]|nr:hypothetical protein [Euryarchaeota archaeon]